MALPAVLFLILFAYKPMYGVIIAFKDYNFARGIMGSKWVGLANFKRLFNSYWFPIILKNTLTLSALGIALSFPAPILLAIMANEIGSKRLKSAFQTISYAPHFIATIVVCGMIVQFLSPSSGVINKAIIWLGGQPVYFIQKPGMFKWIYVFSGIWQGAGWSAIIYHASLSGIDSELLEAASMDGATRLQKIAHIHLPTLVPTILVLLILQCGSILNVGYEKVFALQNSANIKGSEIISTYVYKVGVVQSDFSFSTATGVFNSVVNSLILIASNSISRKAAHVGLW
jgi:putative aldouronate transport system permease protein